MCDKREALAILNEVFNRCSEVIPVTDAYLYGSYARGITTANRMWISCGSALPADAIWPKRRQISRIANALSTDHDVTVSVCVRSREQFQPQAMPYYHNIVNDGIRYAGV